ncbi:hypothetical protein, partial [Bathymodiolus heckerae thiotrophic gill symbiont]|uniref:hypothetical protein n=1 Tax=Bathymodiolus heckerae thiotrophic gill symbiont TaxID=1052212 RepID=UPI0010FE7A3E
MTIFNRFIITALLVLFTSKALAVNTIEVSNTPKSPAQSEVRASLILTLNTNDDKLTVTAKQRLGASGNFLRFTLGGNESIGCQLDEGIAVDDVFVQISCGMSFFVGTSTTSDLATLINTLEHFSST